MHHHFATVRSRITRFSPFDRVANMQFTLINSQRYLFNTNPDTNHSSNPTNPNGNIKW